MIVKIRLLNMNILVCWPWPLGQLFLNWQKLLFRASSRLLAMSFERGDFYKARKISHNGWPKKGIWSHQTTPIDWGSLKTKYIYNIYMYILGMSHHRERHQILFSCWAAMFVHCGSVLECPLQNGNKLDKIPNATTWTKWWHHSWTNQKGIQLSCKGHMDVTHVTLWPPSPWDTN